MADENVHSFDLYDYSVWATCLEQDDNLDHLRLHFRTWYAAILHATA
jgi:hypothetical protein